MAVYLRISNLCDSKDEQQWLFIYGIPMRFFSLCHSLIPDPGTNIIIEWQVVPGMTINYISLR